MKNHSEILAEINRALIKQFEFTHVKITLNAVEHSSTLSTKSGEYALAFKQASKPDLLPVEESFYINTNLVLRTRLYKDGQELKKAVISVTPEFREAGEMWARMTKQRIPGLTIIFEP